MNEIKHIHLGRQSFTIAVEAYRELHDYLEAIKAQVGDKSGDVVEEVELRMAELLTERGIDASKVILRKDITFLKHQLGDPHDFKDEDSGESPKTEQAEPMPRRLFRDPEQAMVAGVAAGLATYFGIDATIMRLIFVLLTFFGGSGVLIYIILWLVVPEAQTSSERLQMRGKAVTVDSLREVIGRANLAGAAGRASKTGQRIGRGMGRSVARVVETCAKVVLAIVGSALVVMASGLFLGATTVGTYLVAHGVQIGSQTLFPVGAQAVVGLFCALAVLVAFAFLVMIAGLTMIRRKAVVRGWIVAAAAGLILVGAGLGTAFGIDIAPAIRDKWRAMQHSQMINVPSFTSVNLTGNKHVTFAFVADTKYAAELQYFGDQHQTSAMNENVTNGVLNIDASKYQTGESCENFCLFSSDWLHIVIHAPNLQAATLEGQGASLNLTSSDLTPNFTLVTGPGAQAFLNDLHAEKTVIDLNDSGGTQQIAMQDITGQAGNDIAVESGMIGMGQTTELDLNTSGATCQPYSPAVVYTGPAPEVMRLNGQQIAPPIPKTLAGLSNTTGSNDYNCVSIQSPAMPPPPAAAAGN